MNVPLALFLIALLAVFALVIQPVGAWLGWWRSISAILEDRRNLRRLHNQVDQYIRARN